MGIVAPWIATQVDQDPVAGEVGDMPAAHVRQARLIGGVAAQPSNADDPNAGHGVGVPRGCA